MSHASEDDNKMKHHKIEKSSRWTTLTISLEIPQKQKLKLNQLTKYPADRQLRLRRLDYNARGGSNGSRGRGERRKIGCRLGGDRGG